MFSKLTILTVAISTVFASAAPTTNKCNVGEVQCCKSTAAHDSETGQAIISLLGAAAGPVTGLIGANCSPLSAVGVAGNSW